MAHMILPLLLNQTMVHMILPVTKSNNGAHDLTPVTKSNNGAHDLTPVTKSNNGTHDLTPVTKSNKTQTKKAGGKWFNGTLPYKSIILASEEKATTHTYIYTLNLYRITDYISKCKHK